MLREAVPTLVMHMAAAAVHLMAVAGMGGSLSPGYAGSLSALLLATPMLAVLAMLSGYPRLGSLLCLASYVGTAGLILFGHLLAGHLQLALFAAGSPWKTLFFITAMLLPLLQIAGIWEAVRSLVPDWAARVRLAFKEN